ncbi:MAG: trehalose-phosphatase [Actinomycetota bacterium]|nr:trehalose-phosphatase [Actinomycetota bacterium]
MKDARLCPFLEAPHSAGLFFDFDGTLSEIVDVPSDARPVEGAVELLSRLSQRFRSVVIVSGRSAVELVRWLGDGVEIWGAHGSQRAVDGRVVLTDQAAPYVDVMKQVKGEAEDLLSGENLEGVVLEEKGVLLNVHYRNVPDRNAGHRSVEEVTARLAGQHGLVIHPGRMSVELRPPVEFSKASVVRDVAAREALRAAAFFGDDLVDLPGFDALDELTESGIATLRVGVDSDETPRELLERSDLTVHGPCGVLKLLRALI